jgi:hypothetical protein
MNIRKALQVKNKAVGDISKKFEKIKKHNVYTKLDDTMVPTYDTKKLLEEFVSDARNLAALKSNIAVANLKIQSCIHLMAELKGVIAKLNEINTQSGEQRQYAPNGQIVSVKTVPQITEQEVEALVKSLENEIVRIQDVVDYHNSTVEV